MVIWIFVFPTLAIQIVFFSNADQTRSSVHIQLF